MLSKKYFWREWYVVVYQRLGGNDRQYHSGTCKTGLTSIWNNWNNFVIMVASAEEKHTRLPIIQWYDHHRKSLNAKNLYQQMIKFDVKCEPVKLAGVFEDTENRIIAPKNRRDVQKFPVRKATSHSCNGNLVNCHTTYTTKDYVAFAIVWAYGAEGKLAYWECILYFLNKWCQ